MRKIIKPLLITLASLLLLLIIAISFTLWFVFTPERITPVINNQAKNIFTCDVEIGEVELTFFSTFPQFSLKVDKFSLINPVDNAPSDTLLSVDQLIGAIDIMSLLKENKVILSGISLSNGTINAYVDTLGRANFDVFVTDTTETEETEFKLEFVDIGHVKLNNINLSYLDESTKINTRIQNLNADINGTIIDDIINTNIVMSGSYISFFDESLKINSEILDLDAEIQATITKEIINSNIKINESIISFVQNDEKYLQNASIKTDIPVKFNQVNQNIQLSHAILSVNDLELSLDGSLSIDTANGDMHNDFKYKFTNAWSLKNAMALIPPSFQSFFKGIDTDGLITSEGTFTGILNDSLMPILDMHVIMNEGYFNYTGFPIPLQDINGDINIYTDLVTDEITYMDVNRLYARTPHSTFQTRGHVRNLFSDIHSDLSTTANLDLDEFNIMIPDSLNINLKGKLGGNIKSIFHLSSAEKLEFENMILSGNLIATDLDIVYDSLWLTANRSDIEFALPYPGAASQNTSFAYVDFASKDFRTGKIDDYRAFMQNASIILETSDIRDTTKIPEIICFFAMDTLSASMDTISIAMRNQSGNASIAPLNEAPKQPGIKLTYKNDGIVASAGKEKALIDKIQLDANVINDQNQSDVLLQWIAEGFVNIDNGHITTTALNHPVEIPSIKMNFNPEMLDIKESHIIIDNSDFKLTGIVDNVLSYYKGDSILRGNFIFESDHTDLLQLMALTSGIGVEEDKEEAPQENLENAGDTISPNGEAMGEADNNMNDTTFAGPYMVPEGMDISLSADIKQATFGLDTAKNITGNVSVIDGILLMDNLLFTTAAARMQLTSMYRTPRKNHLYLGLDYHMMDVEIERLLKMIPEIDTLMPMLRSFRGEGEFHIAIECYLDSTYNIKKSTLRGTSSISGNDLVLLDGETFTEIANTLRFSKKAENMVDSLSAEFTVFREEIDIYPFLIVMDRYSAVVAGRHNFDLSFDYHVTVIDSPLPTRLGLDINGDMDNLSFRLARTRYPEFYRPASRGVVESWQLEFRRMIREEIKERVIE